LRYNLKILNGIKGQIARLKDLEKNLSNDNLYDPSSDARMGMIKKS